MFGPFCKPFHARWCKGAEAHRRLCRWYGVSRLVAADEAGVSWPCQAPGAGTNALQSALDLAVAGLNLLGNLHSASQLQE
jgi:hypothetical protein